MADEQKRLSVEDAGTSAFEALSKVTEGKPEGTAAKLLLFALAFAMKNPMDVCDIGARTLLSSSRVPIAVCRRRQVGEGRGGAVQNVLGEFDGLRRRIRAARKDLVRQGDEGRRDHFVLQLHGECASGDRLAAFDRDKDLGPRGSAVRNVVREISSDFAERDTGLEPATFGLGRTRAIAGIVQKRGDFGQLRTVCLELLTSAARGDEQGALMALARMRAAFASLDVTTAIAVASELLERPEALGTSAA